MGNIAIKVLSENNATSIEGKEYIVPRDSLFLKQVEKFFK